MKIKLPGWIKYFYTATSIIFIILIYPEHNNLFFELIISAAVYILLAGIITGIVLLSLTRSAVVLSGLMVFLLTTIVIFSNTINLINLTSSNHKSAKEISLLHLNVYVYNRQKRNVINTILKKNPHIITLHEISSNWEGNLKLRMKNKYPYSVSMPGTYFGISLYSRYPIINYSTKTIDKT